MDGEVSLRGDPAYGFVLRRALESAADAPDDRLTHGFHVYPARMHPAIARVVLEELFEGGAADVLDPFCGGGTVVVEAMRAGWGALGTDLNPLAIRVARVRSELRKQGARDRFVEAVERVGRASTQRVQTRVDSRAEIAPEHRAKYEIHVLKELAGLLAEIRRSASKADRAAMEMVFSSLVVKCSKQRSDTNQDEVTRTLRKGLVTEMFVRKGRELGSRWAALARAVPRGAAAPRLVCADIQQLRKTLGGQYQCNLILSSPPYGGTYDYVEHHRLRAAWLGVGLGGMEAGEMGARRRFSGLPDEDVAGASTRWDQEVQGMLESMAGCLRRDGIAVLLMGDGEVGGVRVPADAQLERIAEKVGLEFLCAAAQPRVDLRGGPMRREHLVALIKR